MKRINKCEILKSKGYTYNFETGKIFGVFGKEITSKHKQGYINIGGGNYFKGNLFGHHFAYFMMYGNIEFERLDHINQDKTDNRICNLRIVTHQENQFNSNSKGYSWDKKSSKWHSTIGVNKKTIYLGTFDNEEDAHNAYLQAKKIYHIIKEN